MEVDAAAPGRCARPAARSASQLAKQQRFGLHQRHVAVSRGAAVPVTAEIDGTHSFELGEPFADGGHRLTTSDYAVVMPVVSIRFSDVPLHQQLKKTARQKGVSISTLAERLIGEGLRMDAHPMIYFRDNPSSRRARLIGGPDVSHVIDAIVGGDVPIEQRRARAAEMMVLSLAQVDAALAYYADHTAEIDDEIAERLRYADEAEAAWLRQQALLEA